MPLIFFLVDNKGFEKNFQKKILKGTNFDIRIDSFYKSLERLSGSEFDEPSGTVCDHLLHGLHPLYRVGELHDQVLLDAFGINGGGGADVLVNGTMRRCEVALSDGGGQLLLCGLHQRGVEGPAHMEGKEPTGTPFGKFFHGLFQSGFRAGNHQLFGTVVVGRHHHIVGDGCAHLFGDPVVEIQHGHHAGGLEFASALHGLGASRHQTQSLLEGEGAGDGQCRQFAQRMSGHHVGLLFRQTVMGHEGVQEDGGLSHLGLCQFLVAAREHDFRQWESQTSIRLRKQLFCKRILVI